MHIIAQGVDPHTFTLSLSEMYSFYLIPVMATIDGTPVSTSLGELLCNQVDVIIQAKKLKEVIQANPPSQTVNSGDVVSLTIRLNQAALTYVSYSIAWLQDGVLTPDVTTEEISVQVTATTTFQAIVTTPFGVATSDIATITVVPSE